MLVKSDKVSYDTKTLRTMSINSHVPELSF